MSRLISAFLAIVFSFSGLAAVHAQTGYADTGEVEVRVRILEREAPATVTLSGEGSALRLTLDGRSLPEAAPGRSVTVSRTSGGISVSYPGGQATGSSLAVQVSRGATSVVAGSTRRTYEGSLTFSNARGALLIVNQLPIEPYVASVVAGEYPFPEIEGVKAQAVLARTYALRAQRHPRYAGAGYDLVDHTGDQVYHGLGRTTETSRRGTELSAGRVLMHQGELARAQYFSSSGGHTADNETVWAGAPVPYLRGRPDPYDTHSPHHSWSSQIEHARLLQTLTRRYGFQVRDFELGPRGHDGRVHTVRLVGSRSQQVSANEFRLAVTAVHGWRAMRSTNLTMRRSGGTVHFQGSGFGHGVGMSQYGAQAQARAGRTYEEILSFYFTGTEPAAGYGRHWMPSYAGSEQPEGVRTRPTPRAEVETGILGRLGEEASADWSRPERNAEENRSTTPRESERAPRRSAW